MPHRRLSQLARRFIREEDVTFFIKCPACAEFHDASTWTLKYDRHGTFQNIFNCNGCGAEIAAIGGDQLESLRNLVAAPMRPTVERVVPAWGNEAGNAAGLATARNTIRTSTNEETREDVRALGATQPVVRSSVARPSTVRPSTTRPSSARPSSGPSHIPDPPAGSSSVGRAPALDETPINLGHITAHSNGLDDQGTSSSGSARNHVLSSQHTHVTAANERSVSGITRFGKWWKSNWHRVKKRLRVAANPSAPTPTGVLQPEVHVPGILPPVPSLDGHTSIPETPGQTHGPSAASDTQGPGQDDQRVDNKEPSEPDSGLRRQHGQPRPSTLERIPSEPLIRMIDTTEMPFNGLASSGGPMPSTSMSSEGVEPESGRHSISPDNTLQHDLLFSNYWGSEDES